MSTKPGAIHSYPAAPLQDIWRVSLPRLILSKIQSWILSLAGRHEPRTQGALENLPIRIRSQQSTDSRRYLSAIQNHLNKVVQPSQSRSKEAIPALIESIEALPPEQAQLLMSHLLGQSTDAPLFADFHAKLHNEALPQDEHKMLESLVFGRLALKIPRLDDKAFKALESAAERYDSKKDDCKNFESHFCIYALAVQRALRNQEAWAMHGEAKIHQTAIAYGNNNCYAASSLSLYVRERLKAGSDAVLQHLFTDLLITEYHLNDTFSPLENPLCVLPEGFAQRLCQRKQFHATSTALAEKAPEKLRLLSRILYDYQHLKTIPSPSVDELIKLIKPEFLGKQNDLAEFSSHLNALLHPAPSSERLTVNFLRFPDYSALMQKDEVTLRIPENNDHSSKTTQNPLFSIHRTLITNAPAFPLSMTRQH